MSLSRAFIASLVLTYTAAMAQAPSPASEFARAKSLYYTPTDRGLKTFHCDVTMDWLAYLKGMIGDKAADLPALKYLQNVHLTIDDDLHGAGKLTWTAPADPIPAGAEGGLKQIQSGTEQIMNSFFTDWNHYMNGWMVTVTDDKTHVERDGAGFHIIAQSDGQVIEENFDDKLLMKTFHAKVPAMEVTSHPIFDATPDGLIVRSVASQVAMGSMNASLATEVSYKPVSGYQLPAQFTEDLGGPNKFQFTFSNCVVNPAPALVKR